jgi:hypothetical protein
MKHFLALSVFFSLSAFGQSSTITQLTDATTISESDKVWAADVSETGSSADVDMTLEQVVKPFAEDPGSNQWFDPSAFRVDLGLDSLANAESAWLVTLIEPGDNVSALSNDAGYLTSVSAEEIDLTDDYDWTGAHTFDGDLAIFTAASNPTQRTTFVSNATGGRIFIFPDKTGTALLQEDVDTFDELDALVADQTLLNTSTGYTQAAADSTFLKDSELTDLAGVKAFDSSAIDAATVDGNDSSYFATATQNASVVADLATGLLATGPKRNYIYSDGNGPAVTIPQSDAVEVAGLSFVMSAGFALEDWTPGSAVVLVDKVASDLGYRLTLGTDGTLDFAIGNGSDLTTLVYSSTASITRNAWAGAIITVVLDRSNDLIFYVDSEQLGDSLPLALDGQSLTSTADINLLSDGSTHHEGIVYGQFVIHLGTLSQSEIDQRHREPHLWALDAGGQFVDEMDGSTGGRVYPSNGTEVAGLTAEGRSNVVKFYANANSTEHRINVNALVGSLSATLQVDVFIPSGQSHVDGVRIFDGLSASGAAYGTTDEWFTITDTQTWSVGGRIYAVDGSSINFTGANDSEDDYFLLSNLVVFQSGTSLAAQMHTGVQLEDQGGNNLDAVRGTSAETVPALNDWTLRDSITWSASTSTENLLSGELLESGEVIEIYAKASSSGDFTIGDETDADRYFTTATLGTSWAKLTLAAIETDGTNKEITITPDSSYTGTVEILIKVTKCAL